MMDTSRALAWITNVFAIQGRELHATDTRTSVPEWDSLGDLLLLSMLEEELHIVASADDIAAIGSIAEILTLMETHHAFSVG